MLNKGDLKQQLLKLQKAEEGQQTWKMVAIAFGNLSKNSLFNDMSRSTQTNLIFWRKKIRIWKNHPLGLGVILKLLQEYQETNNFVQFCILAAILLEYEVRIHNYLAHAVPSEPQQGVGKVLPGIVRQHLIQKRVLARRLQTNVRAAHWTTSAESHEELQYKHLCSEGATGMAQGHDSGAAVSWRSPSANRAPRKVSDKSDR